MKTTSITPLCVILIALLSFFIRPEIANAIVISLEPTPEKLHSYEMLYVDINISGLHSDGVDSLLGAFSFDLLYESSALSPVLSLSSPGEALGNASLGEAIWDIDASTVGKLQIAEISFLEATDTCVFCIGPYLDQLQSDTFTLATIAFTPIFPILTPTILLDTQAALLSDEFGVQITDNFGNIATVSTPITHVKVSEPLPMTLFAFILLAMFFPPSGGKMVSS